jgi:hypothetical protein
MYDDFERERDYEHDYEHEHEREHEKGLAARYRIICPPVRSSVAPVM